MGQTHRYPENKKIIKPGLGLGFALGTKQTTSCHVELESD